MKFPQTFFANKIDCTSSLLSSFLQLPVFRNMYLEFIEKTHNEALVRVYSSASHLMQQHIQSKISSWYSYFYISTFICLFEFNLLSCIFIWLSCYFLQQKTSILQIIQKLLCWNLLRKLYKVWIEKLIGKKKSELTLLKFIKPTAFIVMWWG